MGSKNGSFSDVQYFFSTDIVGGSEKVQKCADVVYGCWMVPYGKSLESIEVRGISYENIFHFILL